MKTLGIACVVAWVLCADLAGGEEKAVLFGGDTKAVNVEAATITVTGGILDTEGNSAKQDMTFAVTKDTKIYFFHRPDARGLADIKLHDVSHVAFKPGAEKVGGDPVALSIHVYAAPR